MPTRTYFASAAPDGTTDLFVADGTPGGTARILVPGASLSGVQPTDIVAAGSTVLFSGVDSNNRTNLYAYDTTTSAVAELTAPNASSSGLSPYDLTVVGSTVLFQGFDSSRRNDLFAYDTRTGTVAQVSVPNTSGSYNGLSPHDLTVVGSTVLFNGADGSNHGNLYTYDIATGAVSAVAAPGASSDYGLSPYDLTVVGSTVLFNGSDSNNHHNLFSYNTITGAVAEVANPASTSRYGLSPSGLTVVGSTVLFSGTDNSENAHLYSYDTTTGTVAEVTDASGNNLLLSFSATNIIVAGSQALFYAIDSNGRTSLFSYSTLTGKATEITVSGASSGGVGSTHDLYLQALVGPVLLFNGTDSGNHPSLFSYNTDTGVSTEITPANAAPGGLNPQAITSNGKVVTFYGQDVTGTWGVWQSDGTQGGTVELTAPGQAPQGDPWVHNQQPFIAYVNSPAALTLSVPAAATPGANPALAPYGTETVTGTLTAATGASAAGRTVTLLADGAALAAVSPIVTDALGNFSATFALPSTSFTLQATVQDSAGDAASATVTVSGHTNASLFGTVKADAGNLGTQLAALYQGILGHALDAASYALGLSAVYAGTSLIAVAQSLLSSADYTAEYGAATGRSPADFVTTLYQDALGRSPEAAGLQNWITALNSGATQAEVAVGIGLSPEAIGHLRTGFLVLGGVFVASAVDASVARLYYGLLERAPDAGGLRYLEGVAAGSGGLSAVATDIEGSPEYLAAFGGLSNAQYVQKLYENALGREPDAGQGWTGFLNAGTASRTSVALGIAESPEATARLAPVIEQGFRLA